MKTPGDKTHGAKHSALPYVLVWVALLGLTFATFVTGTMHLGRWALLIALTIAITKSTLVVLLFMHLTEHHGAPRLVFVTAVLFVALLLGLSLSDVATRFALATPQGAPFGHDVPSALLEGEAPETAPAGGALGRPTGPHPK